MTRPPRRRAVRPRTHEQLLDVIKAQGYEIRPGKHTGVYRPNGSLLMKLPSTPSDNRGAKNSWMSFKRAVKADNERV